MVKRFEGYVGQSVDDGLFAYFGYPSAHEDDPQRAVRAGLEIIQKIQALNATLRQPLQVRIGLHTGPVVTGESSGSSIAIAGGTPDIASRLPGKAEPNTLLISESTHELIEGYFPCRDLGSQPFAGVSAPVHVHEVLGEKVLQENVTKTRFHVATQKGLTPLVGRDEELGLLRERWQLAKAGNGQVVVIHGEAGIGKSRLIQAFKDEVVDENYARIEYQCSPYAQNSALYPAIDYLQRLLGFTPDESAAEKLQKLEGLLEQFSLPSQETVSLLAALLSLPLPEERYPGVRSPEMTHLLVENGIIV